MRDRLVELCDNVITSCKSSLCEDCEHNNVDYPNCMSVHFADYLLENGVIVPPVKELQEVYVLPTIENGLTDITRMKCLGFTITHDSRCMNLKTEKNKLYQPGFGRFGKTVFLTKEEAEQALRKEDEGK